MLTEQRGEPVRIPRTDQADGHELRRLVGDIHRADANGRSSPLDREINRMRSSNEALKTGLDRLVKAAADEQQAAADNAAEDLRRVLFGQPKVRSLTALPC